MLEIVVPPFQWQEQWENIVTNGILPVENVHRKWHFPSGNFSWKIQFCQWKFSMQNHGLYLVSENLGIS